MLIFRQMGYLFEFYVEICVNKKIIEKSYQIVFANFYLEAIDKVCYAVGKIIMLSSNSINRFFFFNSYLYYRSSYKLETRRMIYCFLVDEGYLVNSSDRVTPLHQTDKFADLLLLNNQVKS